MQVRTKNRGVVVPLIAILMVVLLGMLALAIDIGYITVCKAQLQSATDAAALSGAFKLSTDNLMHLNYQPSAPSQSSDITDAVKAANDSATCNKYGLNGTSPVLLKTVYPTVGYLATPVSVLGTNLPAATTPSGKFVNSAYVKIGLDEQTNTKVPLFFAKIWNIFDTSIAAESTAVTRLFAVKRPDPVPNAYSPFLPIAMTTTYRDDMLNGIKTHDEQYNVSDNYRWIGGTGPSSVDNGQDTLFEQRLYATGNSSDSNNGLLEYGISNTDEIREQIWFGATEAQIQKWLNDPLTPKPFCFPFDIAGQTGWNNAIMSAIGGSNMDATIGTVRVIPICDPSPVGNGQCTYHIVDWATVRIMGYKPGGHGYIIVQPAVLKSSQGVMPDTSKENPPNGGVAVTSLCR